jgi:drug/metabolite transporter (DMT)-like permease
VVKNPLLATIWRQHHGIEKPNSVNSDMAYLLLVLTVLFWSGNFVLGRSVNDIIPPISLAFWRWAGALIILLPFGIKPLLRHREWIMRHWKLLAVMGLLSVTNFSIFIYFALHSTTVVNTVLVNSFQPILIVIASWLGFREKITLLQGIGIMVSLTGLLWILFRGNLSFLLSFRFSSGDLWTLSASISWAIYSVMLRGHPQDIDPISFLEILIVFGALFLTPLYIWEVQTGARIQWSFRALGSIAYVAIFPSILSYLFWNKGVSMVGANKAGIFIHLMPVFSIFLAFLLLGERIELYHWPGIVLIIAGIFLTTSGGGFKTTRGNR